MKILTGLLLLVSSVVAFATTDIETFLYDGSRDAVQLTLNAEQTHTEYRYENRRTTCYRTETYYRTICRSTPHGRHCYTQPYHRTIAYSCIRTISVPYQVKDYDVVATVNLDVKKVGDLPANERLIVSLNGDRLSLSAVGSKKFFILMKKQGVQSRVTGSVKLVEAAYTVELAPAAALLGSLEAAAIALKESVVSVNLGKLAPTEQIGLHLKVKKSKVLASDDTIFNRELAQTEILMSTENEASVASVDIQKLGLALKGKHEVTAKAFYKHAGSLLNAAQFEKLEVSKKLSYKVK